MGPWRGFCVAMARSAWLTSVASTGRAGGGRGGGWGMEGCGRVRGGGSSLHLSSILEFQVTLDVFITFESLCPQYLLETFILAHSFRGSQSITEGRHSGAAHFTVVEACVGVCLRHGAL